LKNGWGRESVNFRICVSPHVAFHHPKPYCK
jgi:hypothetical protein